jgi:hypothetical protein
MDRRTFAVASLSACSIQAIGNCRETAEAPTPEDSKRFRFGDAIKFEMKSTPVEWQGGPIHLLSLSQLTFSFDSITHRLTARARGHLLTFDNVDYTIAITVFAADGNMLGASTVVCHVPRIWCGVYVQQPVDLTLDFGISNSYSHATKFQTSISDRTVLTPDQWQTR